MPPGPAYPVLSGNDLPLRQCCQCKQPCGEPGAFVVVQSGAILHTDGTRDSGGPDDRMSAYLSLLKHDPEPLGPVTQLDLVHDLVGGQADLIFCSTVCLRRFLNDAIDELERRSGSRPSPATPLVAASVEPEREPTRSPLEISAAPLDYESRAGRSPSPLIDPLGLELERQPKRPPAPRVMTAVPAQFDALLVRTEDIAAAQGIAAALARASIECFRDDRGSATLPDLGIYVAAADIGRAAEIREQVFERRAKLKSYPRQDVNGVGPPANPGVIRGGGGW